MIWDLMLAPFADFGFMRRALLGCIAVSVGATPVGVFLLIDADPRVLAVDADVGLRAHINVPLSVDELVRHSSSSSLHWPPACTCGFRHWSVP